jgi:hypothetical protein
MAIRAITTRRIRDTIAKLTGCLSSLAQWPPGLIRRPHTIIAGASATGSL